MASQPLLNYLLTRRKRSALSQEEVAFLLGVLSSAQICRYERLLREPSLQTALAFEVIFNCPVSELFPELFAQIQTEVASRATELETKDIGGNSNDTIARKRKTLDAIISEKLKNKFKRK